MDSSKRVSGNEIGGGGPEDVVTWWVTMGSRGQVDASSPTSQLFDLGHAI